MTAPLTTTDNEAGQPSAGPDATSSSRRPLGRLLRMLFRDVPDAPARLALSLLLSFLATGSSVALMGVSAWLLSRAAEHPPVLYLQVAAVLVRTLGISRGVFRYLERLVGHDVALRLQGALRLETYDRLARTTLLGSRRGDLLSRVIADVEAIQDLVVRVWIPFAAAALVITATSTAIAAFSPGSAMVLLGSAILAGLVVPALARKASQKADATAVPLRGELASATHELARTTADLVAYGADTAALAKLGLIDARLREVENRATWVRGLAAASQALAAGASVIAALVIGGQQVADGILPPVMLAVLVLTPLALHEAMSSLTESAQRYTRAKVALERVQDVIYAPPVGRGDVPGEAAVVADPSLTLTNVSAGWPGQPALMTGFTLDIRPGERVALVGPSGVGKTTLAATILGLIPAQAGTIDVRGRLGYLAQDAHIFATTIAENVRLGNPRANDDEVDAALARAGLALDPTRMLGELGSAVSGGEARRIALARLFVDDYQVLILDEPSEHLDALTAGVLLDDIWASTNDRPMLVITHDAAVIERCDRSVRLGHEPGPLAEVSPPLG